MLGLGVIYCFLEWGGEEFRGSLFLDSMPFVLFYSPTAYPNNFWKFANCVMYKIKLNCGHTIRTLEFYRVNFEHGGLAGISG